MQLLAILALTGATSAHFTLDYPNSTNPKADLTNENIPPCGGFNPNFDGLVSNFSVSGDWVQVNTHHPEAVFRFRVATIDNTTWIDLNSAISEVGLGTFCIQAGPAPANFAGKTGVLQVIGNGADGALFECAAVMFTNDSAVIPATKRCANGSDVTVAFNESATFGVPSVPFNATSVQASSSSSPQGTSGAARGAKTSTDTIALVFGTLLFLSHLVAYLY